MLPLLLTSSIAGAVPAQFHICSPLRIPPGARAACDCIFLADEDEWIDPHIPSQLSGSCLEFTVKVNPVQDLYRGDVLSYMDWMARALSCGASPDRKFERTLTQNAAGYVWVASQYLETMADDSCNIGAGSSEMIDFWLDEGRGRWIVGPVWEPLVEVIPSYKEAKIQRVLLSIDEDGNEEIAVAWTDGEVWRAEGPFFPDQPIEPPK